MTIDEVKIWLNRAYKIDELIQLDKKKLEELEELKTTLGRMDTSEKVQTSKNLDTRYVNTIVNIDETKRQLNSRIIERYNVKEEIDEVINSLEDNEYILVLTLRYYFFTSWKNIRKKLGYNESKCFKIHNRAIKEVSKLL